MENDTKRTNAPSLTLAELARESAKVEPQGKLNSERLQRTHEISAGLVEGLVEQATQAARKAIQPDTSAAWHDVCEILRETGLSPVMTCAKTGREIYTLAPEHFAAHLQELSRLGASRQADNLQSQLIRAIEAQKAYTALPSTITASAGNMAFLRDACPLDYAVIALQDAFPADKKATTSELARRAENVRQARASLTALDNSALAYLCECLHLYLANIKPSSLAQVGRENTLSVYKKQALAEIVETPAKIAHLCRRIVQLAFNLISKHQARPLSALTSKAIINLRVHYQGLPQYKAQQQERRANAATRAFEAKKALAKARAQNAKPLLSGQLARLLDDITRADKDDIESMVLDMVAAFGATIGKPVTVGAETPAQADVYREIHAASKAAQAANAQADAYDTETPQSLVDLFASDTGAELMGFAESGLDLDELTPIIETADDLLTHGFAEIGEFEEWQDENLVDQEETDLPDLPPMPDQISLAMAEPMFKAPTSPRASAQKPKTPKPAPAPAHAPAPKPKLAPATPRPRLALARQPELK